MLKDMPKNAGAAQKGWKDERPTKTEGRLEDPPPTYAELGIDYKDASRLQRAAEYNVTHPYLFPMQRNRLFEAVLLKTVLLKTVDSI